MAKALDVFGPDGENDSPEGLIKSASQFPVWEVKATQWRGGVWRDPGGVCWLIVAGLAKGGHGDRDDFNKTVERAHERGGAEGWLPTDQDQRLLKQETAARLLLESQLRIQATTATALKEAMAGHPATFGIRHPAAYRLEPEHGVVAHVSISVDEVRDEGTPTDDVVVDVEPTARWVGSDIWWQAAIRVIVSIAAPEQAWDAFGTSFSTIGEPGSWAVRAVQLDELVANGVLAESEPGTHAHYTHRPHLAGQTIEGRAARAMCGAFFVPCQDFQSRPVCPDCQRLLDELPGE